MFAERTCAAYAWPIALLACTSIAAACSTESTAPFFTGVGQDPRQRDAGSDRRGSGGNSGSSGRGGSSGSSGSGSSGGSGGGGNSGAGGSDVDGGDPFAEVNWAPGDPSGLDPEKVYITLDFAHAGGEIELLDLVYPGGDPAKDTGHSMLAVDVLLPDNISKLPYYPPKIRRDGALIRRNNGSSLYVVNTARGDIKISKCLKGMDSWMIHPTMGSVVFHCPDETLLVERYYQSIREISEGVTNHRDFPYPDVPVDYTALHIGPHDELLLRKSDSCDNHGCTEFVVQIGSKAISVPLPDKWFFTRVLFFRNTDGAFRLLVHSRESFTAPPPPTMGGGEQVYPPVEVELWEITYEGVMSRVYAYTSPPFVANGCMDDPQRVYYPMDPGGNADYSQPPFVRANVCQCALAADGAVLCASQEEVYLMRMDGTNELFYSIAGTGTGTMVAMIDALVTGP